MKAKGRSLVLGSGHEKLAEVAAMVPRREAAIAPDPPGLGAEPIPLSAAQHKYEHVCKGLFSSDFDDDQNTFVPKRFSFYELLPYEVFPQPSSLDGLSRRS